MASSLVVTDWHVFVKELRLRCKQKRKFRATTNPNQTASRAKLLNQTFAPTYSTKSGLGGGPDVCATQEGWLYLAGIKDVYTCKLSATPWRAHDKRADR
ncbi:hypothetical protein ACULNC_22020 [Shigella flexneri]